MASVKPYRLTIGLKDKAGGRAAIPLYINQGATLLADVLTAATAYATLIGNMTDAQVVSIEVAVPIAVPLALNGPPTTGVYLPRTGLFTFAVPDLGTTYSIDIPAVAQTMILEDATGLHLDLTNGVLLNFVNAVVAGQTEGTEKILISTPSDNAIGGIAGTAFLKSSVNVRKRPSNKKRR